MAKLNLILKAGLLVSVLVLSACAPQELDQTYEGVYVFGAEVNTFTTCDKKQSYWASFNWAGLEMQSFYKQNSAKPYQPMYIKFKGHLLNEKIDGFALNYDGLIRISAVQEYSFEVPAKCQ